MNNLRSLVERKLVPVGKSGKDTIYVCPKCDDVSGHLWVNYDTNKFHCFKCSYAGRSIVKLVQDLGIDIKFDYTSLLSSYEDDLSLITSTENKVKRLSVDYSRNLEVVTDYFNYHTQPLSVTASEYLKSRGLSDYWIEKFRIKEGKNNYGKTFQIKNKEYIGRDYSFRIMIPSVLHDGQISFYVARDYLNNRKMKYLNPPKEISFSSEDVWNLDNIESNHVIICEGVFSAIAIIVAMNKNIAVATYGKSIASKSNTESNVFKVTSQGEKLLSKGFQSYTVFYDRDALTEALKTCKYLKERGAFVRLATIPEGKYGSKADANDLTPEEVNLCIKNAEIYDDFLEFKYLI